MNEALEQSQSNCAALSAALNNAITVSIACQLANTARSYAKGQRLWNEFCAECQFNDGVLISEEKLVLWLQDVVLLLGWMFCMVLLQAVHVWWLINSNRLVLL